MSDLTVEVARLCELLLEAGQYPATPAVRSLEDQLDTRSREDFDPPTFFALQAVRSLRRACEVRDGGGDPDRVNNLAYWLEIGRSAL